MNSATISQSASTDQEEPVSPERSGSSWRQHLLVGLLLAVATFAAHGWTLGDGLFFDDHLHQQRLREMGWSPSELLQATTVDSQEFIETWWQQRVTRWQYARPFSVLLMKIVHDLTGGSVLPQHAMSLTLHWVTTFLVYLLCLRLTEHRFWSVLGGLLFVVYSHAVITVGWLAAQNTILQTVLTIAALLCYLRASGLYVGPAATGLAPARDVPPLRPAAMAVTLVLWVLALFSRENAVMLPVVLVAVDLAFGGRRHAWARRRVHGLLVLLAVAFVVWRLVLFYHPLPDVYMRRPDGSGYWLWCLAKLMYYVTALVWQSPMTVGPSGRIDPFTENPADCLLMFVILAVMGGGYFLACRGARGVWIWPMWLVLAVLPVVPVLATPHSGYFGGVAFAVALVLGPGLRRHVRPVWVGRWSPGVAIVLLICTCIWLPIYRTLWMGMVTAERCTVTAIADDEPPSAEVTDLFFINLPFVNIYGKLCLTEEWGPAMADVRCHVLTYAPDVARMERPCRLEQRDAHSFTVSVDGKPYFSSLLGRFLVEAQRGTGRFQPGEVISAKNFDVRIDEVDAEGVWSLTFAFHEPLASERYRFYMTTDTCPAVRLRFREDLSPGGQLGLASPHKTVECPLAARALQRRRDALFAVRRVAAKIIRSDLYLTGPPFPGPR